MAQLIDMNDSLAQAEYQRRVSLAKALREQAASPMGGVAGNIVVPVSPFEGLGRLAATLRARHEERAATEGLQQYAQQKQAKLAQTLAGIGDLKTPEDYQRVGASLVGDDATRELGTQLMLKGADRAQQQALMAQFYPQGGATPEAASQGTSAPAGGGFDMRRYLAMISSGNPALVKAAEAERAASQVPAGTRATLDQAKAFHDELSPYQQIMAAIAAGNLGVAQGNLGINRDRLYYDTGLGGQAPQQPAPPVAGSTAPSAAPGQAPPAPASAPALPAGMSPKTANDLMEKQGATAIERRAKLVAELPKASASARQTMGSLDSMDQYIDDLLGPDGNGSPGLKMIAGRANSLTPDLRQKAVDSANKLETLRSKLLVDTLMNIKSLSENGASGFGALSEKEGEAIRNAQVALQRSSSPETLAAELRKLKAHNAQMRNNVQSIYQSTYAPLLGQSPTQGMDADFSARKPNVVDWSSLGGGH